MIIFHWKCKAYKRYKGIQRKHCCISCWLKWKFRPKVTRVRIKVNPIAVAPENIQDLTPEQIAQINAQAPYKGWP